MCILNAIIFPSFDLSFVFVKGAFIFRCVWGEVHPSMFMMPTASQVFANDTDCTKTVTSDCLTPQLAWAVQEPLLWCFVCTHAQIKATTLLIKQEGMWEN